MQNGTRTTAMLEITRKPAAPSLRKRRETTAILDGHRFHTLTDGQLHFALKDARDAADCMCGFDPVAECKYLDQINDACTILAMRDRDRALNGKVCDRCGILIRAEGGHRCGSCGRDV